DHTNDLLFQADDGTLRSYEIVNSQVASSHVLEVLTPDRHVAGVGDYTGDGIDDFVVRRDDGTFELHQIQNGSVTHIVNLGQVSTSGPVGGGRNRPPGPTAASAAGNPLADGAGVMRRKEHAPVRNGDDGARAAVGDRNRIFADDLAVGRHAPDLVGKIFREPE